MQEYGEWASMGLIGKYGENSQDEANGRVQGSMGLIGKYGEWAHMGLIMEYEANWREQG